MLENPEMTQKEIGELVGMHYQHVWRALDRLVTEGILTKERRNRRTYFQPSTGFYEIEDIKRLNSCLSALSMLHLEK